MKTIAILFISAFICFSCQNDPTSIENNAGLKHTCDSLLKQDALEEANKKLVADFYQALFGDKNISIVDSLIDIHYIQHNPILPDGRKPLKEWVGKIFANAPKEKVDIQRIGADGNLVYIHTRAKFGGKIFSVIDIFRVENGLIMEHWDVMQEVPEKSANPHPMF